MSKNKATYVVLIILVVLSAIFFMGSIKLDADSQNMSSLGPGYFPWLLSIALFVLTLISFYKTYKKEDEKIELGNMKLFAVTVLASLIFVATWTMTGIFYSLAFVLLMGLFYLFNSNITKENRVKILFQNTVISIGLVLCIYLVFQKLMLIRF